MGALCHKKSPWHFSGKDLRHLRRCHDCVSKETDGIQLDMDVSENRGTPKSSILIGLSIIFTIHFGVPLFLETPISSRFASTSSWRSRAVPFFCEELNQRVFVQRCSKSVWYFSTAKAVLFDMF